MSGVVSFGMDPFKFAQAKFQPVVPSVFVNQQDTESALISGDVGIKFTKINSFESTVKRWRFFFPLNYFKDPLQNQNANNSFDNSELFGRIIHPHMLQSVTKLSKINPDERESYVMTLESR